MFRPGAAAAGGGGGNNDQQQWTVHAEFTIKHDGLDDAAPAPVTYTERDENGVKMVYTWTPQPLQEVNAPPLLRSPEERSTPETARDPQLPYGFQKGNLVFTSTPPKRRADSSGYGSERLSPNSSTSRQQQAYNRRCRSTCSIVLSTDLVTEPSPPGAGGGGGGGVFHPECGRTQSLRCQTPQRAGAGSDYARRDCFYGCGDPWCYHNEDFYKGGFPPLPEGDEYSASSKRPSRASTFNVRSRSSPPKVDASVQTYEMIDKCTSPFPGSSSTNLLRDSGDVKFRRNANKKAYGSHARRKTEPIFRRDGSSFSPDSLDNQQHVKRTVKAPKSQTSKSSTPDTKSSDKKSRTVHIDVYCTGTELESSSSCSDSETNKTTSSPQTVFESEKFRLTHKRIENEKGLPYKLRKDESSLDSLKKSGISENKDESDGESTAYPSQRSSYSHIKDFASSLSSVPQSFSTVSMSSYDSTANTSWKDTYSDFGSLLGSRSSIAQTESLDFVPRRLYQRESIDETPENDSSSKIEIPSRSSLQPSDSFEYANSEDKARIKQMERMWENNNVVKVAPGLQRRHLVQQKKIQEYMEKKMNVQKESDSGTDSDEKAWPIEKKELHLDPKKVAETVVKCAQKKQIENNNNSNNVVNNNPTRTPSILAIKERLSLDPSVSSPFTMFPGVYTDQRTVARRFGNIVNVFKKPGHHIGPAKNPDCMCDHCREYFRVYGMRGRARSWGESTVTVNWKEMARASVPRDHEKTGAEKSKDNQEGFTDF